MLDKIVEKYYYFIPILVILLLLVILLIYTSVSSKKNKKVKSYAILDRNMNSYSMKIDFKNEINTLYRKGNKKGIHIPFDVFIQLILPEDQKKYKAWIDKIQTKRLDEKEFLYLTISNLESDTSTEFYKLSYYDYTGSTIFCNVSKTNREVIEQQDIKLYTFDEFRQVYGIEKQSCKTMYAINFGLYTTILNRYGTVAADQYLKKLYSTLLQYKNKNNDVMHYKDDTFLMPFFKFGNFRGLSFFSNRLINELTRTLFFFNIQVEIAPRIGIASTYSGFSSITEFAESAYSASLNTSSSRIRFYDERMVRAKKKNQIESEELKVLMNNFYKSTELAPAISFIDGLTIGFFPEVKFDHPTYKSFNDGFELAKRIDKITSYFYNSVIQWIKKFEDEEKNSSKLFIFTDSDRIFNIRDILNSTQKHTRQEIVIILTDYDAMINKPEAVKDLIKATADFGVSLGVVASEKMITSLSNSLNFFTWLIIPNKLSADIVVNTKTRFKIQNILNATQRFNFNVLAYHVTDYPVAEALKTLGIDFIEGPILANDGDDMISKRQLAKLLDEGDMK